MSLSEEERKTLIKLYLQRAWETFNDAMLAIEAERWSMAANRLYYALFHATTALFVHDGIGVHSHRGVKAIFGQNYIMTNKMPIEYSKLLTQMESIRDKADYNIMFEAESKDVLPYVDISKKFIKAIVTIVTE